MIEHTQSPDRVSVTMFDQLHEFLNSHQLVHYVGESVRESATYLNGNIDHIWTTMVVASKIETYDPQQLNEVLLSLHHPDMTATFSHNAKREWWGLHLPSLGYDDNNDSRIKKPITIDLAPSEHVGMIMLELNRLLVVLDKGMGSAKPNTVLEKLDHIMQSTLNPEVLSLLEAGQRPYEEAIQRMIRVRQDLEWLAA